MTLAAEVLQSIGFWAYIFAGIIIAAVGYGAVLAVRSWIQKKRAQQEQRPVEE